MKDLEISYASTATESIKDQVDFLVTRREMTRQDAMRYVRDLSLKAEKQIRSCPVRPTCYEMKQLGIYTYSQIFVEPYRFIFGYDRVAGLAMIALCIHERQSIRQQLERYLLSSNR